MKNLMTPKENHDKKDYIDEYDEWQRNQFQPAYFVGGRIPAWIKYPGNRKRLGLVFLVMGFIYAAWVIYNIFVSIDFISAVFVGVAAFILILTGVKLILRK